VVDVIPLLLFFDPDLPRRLAASQAVPQDVITIRLYNVVRPVAVGYHVGGACYTLFSMRQSIVRSLTGAIEASAAPRTTRAGSIAPSVTFPEWVALGPPCWWLPSLQSTLLTQSWKAAVVAAIVMTVSAFCCRRWGYLVGLVGSSNQPVSGLTLSALVLFALVMLTFGVKGIAGVAAVLGVAAVVCCVVVFPDP